MSILQRFSNLNTKNNVCCLTTSFRTTHGSVFWSVTNIGRAIHRLIGFLLNPVAHNPPLNWLRHHGLGFCYIKNHLVKVLVQDVKEILERVRKKIMVWLKILLLVATVTDGDGLTSCGKSTEFAGNFLRKPLIWRDRTDGNILRCPYKYPLVWLKLLLAVWQPFLAVITAPSSPPPPDVKVS